MILFGTLNFMKSALLEKTILSESLLICFCKWYGVSPFDNYAKHAHICPRFHHPLCLLQIENLFSEDENQDQAPVVAQNVLSCLHPQNSLKPAVWAERKVRGRTKYSVSLAVDAFVRPIYLYIKLEELSRKNDEAAQRVDNNDVTSGRVEFNDVSAKRVEFTNVTAKWMELSDVTAERVELTDVTTKSVELNNVTVKRVDCDSETTDRVELDGMTVKRVKLNGMTAKRVDRDSETADGMELNSMTAYKLGENGVIKPCDSCKHSFGKPSKFNPFGNCAEYDLAQRPPKFFDDQFKKELPWTAFKTYCETHLQVFNTFNGEINGEQKMNENHLKKYFTATQSPHPPVILTNFHSIKTHPCRMPNQKKNRIP